MNRNYPSRVWQQLPGQDSGGHNHVWRKLTPLILVLFLIGGLLLQPQFLARAQATLQIELITWNTIGLDNANINVGPNIYPVGSRVCNTGNAAAANVNVEFEWVTTNNLFTLLSPSSFSIGSLPAGDCQDFYFRVAITRDATAFGPGRQYAISADINGGSKVSTPTRELFVERLAARDNLATNSISGPQNVIVGQRYDYVVQSNTTGENYRQLEHFLNLPDNAFRLVSASSTYSAPAGAANDSVYADACGWVDDPTITTTYRTCGGTPGFTGGIISGTLVTTYTLEILSAGSYTLTHTLFGLSGDQYFYNADFGADTLAITATVPIQSEWDTYLPFIVKAISGGPTGTPTPTGPTPTPTFTGTIVPSPGATKSISPSEARINQSFTFTIRVTNSGSAPAQNVTLTDNLSAYTYLTITNLETTRGTVNINARTAVVNIGTVYPGEVVTVTLTVTVNNTVTTTTNPCNTATISFTGGSRTSNQQCFRVLGGAVLPGTGELPIEISEAGPDWPIMISGFFLGILAALFALLGIKAASRRDRHVSLYLGGGLILGSIALIAGLVGSGLIGSPNLGVDMEAELSPVTINPQDLTSTPSPTINPLAVNPAYLFATPLPEVETLPSYPIPSPTIQLTPSPGADELDTSAITRILIPSLEVDARVAYVPFDGHTWLIQGLREEVAWMGDTSWPGLGGNTGLAGHVTVRGLPNGGPFRHLDSIHEGELVVLHTEQKVYTYVVREKQVVEEWDLTVIEPTDNAQVTLVTCVEWNDRMEAYLKRLVVVADLLRTESIALANGN